MIKPPTAEFMASITMLSASCAVFWERSGGISPAEMVLSNFLDLSFIFFICDYAQVEFLLHAPVFDPIFTIKILIFLSLF